jgi:hypothetical protein
LCCVVLGVVLEKNEISFRRFRRFDTLLILTI